MEKPSSKSKSKILRLLPKAARAAVFISFKNPPFSPVREKRADGKLKSHLHKGPTNFETQEPTSPKISCMGQIKHNNKLCKIKQAPIPREFNQKNSKPPSGIAKIFSGRGKSDASINHGKPPLPDRAPSISQMTRFASSRDTLANFDWNSYYDEDRSYSDGEDDAGIPFSAPLLMSRVELPLEPRKEINLWKRRTMAQPHPLQLY